MELLGNISEKIATKPFVLPIKNCRQVFFKNNGSTTVKIGLMTIEAGTDGYYLNSNVSISCDLNIDFINGDESENELYIRTVSVVGINCRNSKK